MLAIYLFFLILTKGIYSLRQPTWIALCGAMSYPFYLIHNKAGKQLYDKVVGDLPFLSAILLVLLVILFTAYIVVLIERKISEFMVR